MVLRPFNLDKDYILIKNGFVYEHIETLFKTVQEKNC